MGITLSPNWILFKSLLLYGPSGKEKGPREKQLLKSTDWVLDQTECIRTPHKRTLKSRRVSQKR